MKLTPKQQAIEIGRCYNDPAYFIKTYCFIYDPVGEWIPFELWPAQVDALRVVHSNRLAVILKARQLGVTWLVLGYALWTMIFRPAATVLLFSRRDDEARYLLSDERLKGMYKRLPAWMLSGHGTVMDNAHEWSLSNGSVARAFPSTAGDSYTATLAIIDEADIVPDLGRLMRSVKPTIDGGGRMVLLSRPDKSRPVSEFKRIYTEGKAGRNGWAHIFLPWHVNPKRDAAWYEAQKADIQSRTGSLDDLAEQYPTTDAEALAARSLDKRIPGEWLAKVFAEKERTNPLGIPGLSVFVEPQEGHKYAIGADPAEGNPTSDDSAATVLDKATGEEVATLAGKFQPSTFAGYLAQLSAHYLGAVVMVERNNHGHACLLWLYDNTTLGQKVLNGHDGKKGWLSSTKGKPMAYATTVDAIRDGDVVIHDFESYAQLASIEGGTMAAPENLHDDRAYSFCLAVCAMAKGEPIVQTMANPFYGTTEYNIDAPSPGRVDPSIHAPTAAHHKWKMNNFCKQCNDEFVREHGGLN